MLFTCSRTLDSVAIKSLMVLNDSWMFVDKVLSITLFSVERQKHCVNTPLEPAVKLQLLLCVQCKRALFRQHEIACHESVPIKKEDHITI